MKQLTRGFTLMEMVGVVAVIAILASVATPMVLSAIENSRVSSTLGQVRTVQTAVTQFYADTGVWPRHRNPTTRNDERQLLNNLAYGGGTINGWNGPYLETDIDDLISRGSEVLIFHETRDNEKCDTDGDGTPAGDTMLLRFDNISDDMARKLSDANDGDGTALTGTTAWNVAGRARRGVYRSNGMTICIAQT